jgi:hypothetical protein
MERDLSNGVELPRLPAGYRFVGWNDRLVSEHARVKHECFEHETDSDLFECLGHRPGCESLMVEIATHRGFLAAATWLVENERRPVATAQAVQDGQRRAVVPNLGVVPEFRRLGIGKALLLQTMHSLVELGIRRVWLEVTAENLPALRLYRQLGFKRHRTLFRPAEKRRSL